MNYIYGTFPTEQTQKIEKLMHNEIHKLLLHKDPKVTDKIFENENDFQKYFENLLYRFGGLNSLLNYPPIMILLLSSLQSALDETKKNDFNFYVYRKLILNSHGYLSQIFNEGKC